MMAPRHLSTLPLLVASLAFSQIALAQPSRPAADPALSAAAKEQVVELSPFQVSTDAFHGYTASQTLAGSRLKMNVDEVGSSIQILTPEFMRDVGATGINDLFLYATSTESSGLNGNFSDFSPGTTTTNDESTRVNPQGSQRVRGLAPADLTRNYFLSLIPTDRFNTELVEINRGANAILFGLGSPAGIANTQLAPAKFKNAHEVRLAVDQEGSFRKEASFNQVVVPRKLAVRFAALQDDKKYYQHPAFEDDHRQYGAFNARPWQGAVVRGLLESGGRYANRPNTLPPSSTIASWLANQPVMVQRMRAVLAATPGANLSVPDDYPLVYSAIAQSWRAVNTTNAYLTTASIPDGVKLAILRDAVIWQDNNATNPRMIFHPNMSRQIAAVYVPGAANPGGAVGGGAAIESNIQAIANPPLAMNPDGVGGAPAYNYFSPEQPWRTNPVIIPVSLTNLAMFDFTRNMLSGSASFQNDKWSQGNIAFEQTALDERVGIELVYDRQHYRRSSYVPFQNFSGIFVDLMQDYLGQANPNLGRAFVMDRASLLTQDDTRESFRATGFVRLDPERSWKNSRLAKWLGRHTLTGVFSTYDQKQENSSVGQYFTDPVGGFVFNQLDAPGSNRRKVNNIIYLTDRSVIGARSEGDIRLTPLTSQQLWSPGRTVALHTYNTTTNAYEDVTLHTAPLVESRSRDTQNIDTLAGTWSGSFLSNHLIGVWGWRQDSVVSGRRQAVTGSDALADLGSLGTPASLLSRIDDAFHTTSWSVVGKLPERWLHMPFAAKLSAYYGESKNFSLSATANDVYAAQLPSPSGNTKEMGVMLNLWDSKLNLRINRYETNLANGAADSKYSVLVNQGILKPYEFLLDAQTLGNRGATTPNYALAMDALAKLKGLIPARTLAAAGLTAPTANGYYSRSDIPNLGDTQDTTGKGTEIEVVYNPTPGWRLALNVAHQKTVIANYAPRVAQLWSAVEPILGSGGMIGNLRYFNDASAAAPTFISHPTPVAGDGNTTVAQWLETNVLSAYRNQKKQEGRVSNDQRAWRSNFVANYDFRSGRLKGWGLGTAVRWQDKAVIGYPTQLIGDTLVADIDHPHYAPAMTNVDAWLRYKRRIFQDKIEWTLELRVLNLNHTAQDLIPVRSALTTTYSVAQYRVGPPQIWSLGSSFKF
jgi:hypothetical protein